MRRMPVLAATLLAASLSLTACGGGTENTQPSGPATSAGTASPSATGTTVDITIKGGKVTPNGERVKTELGAPVTLRIDADTAGEIHVHSTPEQEIAYDAGTSTHQVTIDQPGIVDIESHDLEKVVVQVEVR